LYGRTRASSSRPRDLERIDALAHSIVNRLLHEPTLRIKELQDDRVHARMALLRDLFGLADEDVLDDDVQLAEVRELPQRRG
jgi:glutamyl-tRNA reductase